MSTDTQHKLIKDFWDVANFSHQISQEPFDARLTKKNIVSTKVLFAFLSMSIIQNVIGKIAIVILQRTLLLFTYFLLFACPYVRDFQYFTKLYCTIFKKQWFTDLEVMKYEIRMYFCDNFLSLLCS